MNNYIKIGGVAVVGWLFYRLYKDKTTLTDEEKQNVMLTPKQVAQQTQKTPEPIVYDQGWGGKIPDSMMYNQGWVNPNDLLTPTQKVLKEFAAKMKSVESIFTINSVPISKNINSSRIYSIHKGNILYGAYDESTKEWATYKPFKDGTKSKQIVMKIGA